MNKAQEYVVITEALPYDFDEGWFESILSEEDYHSCLIIEDKILNSKRWSVHKAAVVQFDDDSYLRLTYEEPATENQDCYPHYCAVVVEPYEATITRYRNVAWSIE